MQENPQEKHIDRAKYLEHDSYLQETGGKHRQTDKADQKNGFRGQRCHLHNSAVKLSRSIYMFSSICIEDR